MPAKKVTKKVMPGAGARMKEEKLPSPKRGRAGEKKKRARR
jgi:hypothetical protein